MNLMSPVADACGYTYARFPYINGEKAKRDCMTSLPLHFLDENAFVLGVKEIAAFKAFTCF